MDKKTDSWREMLADEMKQHDDKGPVVAYAPDETAFDILFNSDYGHDEGPPVLAWTETRVYFPVVYDGAEWMGSAPRNPTDNGQAHVGG